MKRMLSVLMTLMILLCPVSAWAENQAGDAGDRVLLDLDIGFEENTISSRYNVDLYVGDECIATLSHGKRYRGSLEVAPGSYTLAFRKSGNPNVNGSIIVSVGEATSLTCTIHAHMGSVDVTGVRTRGYDPDDPLQGDVLAWHMSGRQKLSLQIRFERNAALSRYDVDLYLDGEFLTTLPHGTDYRGDIGIPRGEHTMTFCKAGTDPENGTRSVFSVKGDAAYSCSIKATGSGVKISKEKIN